MPSFLIILLAIAIFPSTPFTVATAAMTMTTEIEDTSCKKLKMTDDLADVNIPSQSEPSHVPKAPYRRKRIVLLGDSITQLSSSASDCGWGSHLADVYQRRADVFNRGMSGYNTDWYLKYLETEEGCYDLFGSMRLTSSEPRADDEQVQASDVQLVTIFFGANDSSCSKLNPRHHVPIPRFKSNLKSIAALCQKNYGHHVRIIFITPPPVHHESRLKYQVQRYGKEKATGQLERNMDLAAQYAQAVEEVAKELNHPCLNIFQSMQDTVRGEGDDDSNSGSDSWGRFLSDGLHLSREGNIYVGQQLQKLIDNTFPDIAVTACPHTSYMGNSASKGGPALFGGSEKGVGPWHDEINHLNPDKAFDSHESFKRK